MSLAKARAKDAIWAHVDNSMEGYGDLVQSCLDRMTMDQLTDVLESLTGGDIHCHRCGSSIDDDGHCEDETCPYSDRNQAEEFTEA